MSATPEWAQPCRNPTGWGHRPEDAVTAVEELTKRFGWAPTFNMLAMATTLTDGVLCMCAISQAEYSGQIIRDKQKIVHDTYRVATEVSR